MEEPQDESRYIRKEPCPSCGSRDNLARYSDGHGFCFGCDHYEPAEDGLSTVLPTKNNRHDKGFQVDEETLRAYQSANTVPLKTRKIPQETCERYGYRVGKVRGTQVQIAPYFRDGQLVGIKTRDANKNFAFLGGVKNPPFFGQHLQTTGKMVCVFEGEIDAMTASIYMKTWPCWSVATGAKGAVRQFKDNLAALNEFEKVVLFFDMDEIGQESAKECAALLKPGKAFIATCIGAKDANELHTQGRGEEIAKAIWQAKLYRPDGMLTIEDVEEEAIADPVYGLPWYIPIMTERTYGRSAGDVYALGAGTGVGKTDFVTQQIEYDLMTLKEKVAVFSFEQMPVETLRRIAGKHVGKVLHVPNPTVTPEVRKAAIHAVKGSGRLFMYDSRGTAEWDAIQAHIEFLALSEDVKLFYVDNLTAMAAMEDDEKKALEQLMAQVAGLAKRLGIIILLVSHLATPDGKPHEEGGRVMIRHFKGSRAIGFWCHLMIGMERNQQDPDQENQSVIRILKDRKTGRSTGLTIDMIYDPDTGRLNPADAPF